MGLSPRLLSLCALAHLAACSFDPSVPAKAKISCSATGDCPDDMRCVEVVGICLAGEPDGVAPVAVDIEVAPGLLGAGDVLDVSFGVDEPLLVDPVVTVGSTLFPATLEGGRYHASAAVDDLVEGVYPVTTVLTDALGSVGVSVLGVVEVDLTAPLMLEDTVVLTLVPPAGSTVAVAEALTPGGRALLQFATDGALGAEPVVEARLNGTTLPFTRTGGAGFAHEYLLALSGTTEAGAYQIAVHVQDAIGNEADQLLTIALPVAEVLVSPCVAQRADGTELCTDVDGDGHFSISGACSTGTDCDDVDATTRPGSIDVPGSGRDGDCDGVGTDLDDNVAVFLSPLGTPQGAGTRADPTNDVAAAMDLAEDRGARFVFASAGTYPPPLDVRSNISFIGGLDETWTNVVGVSAFEPHGDSPLLIGGGIQATRISNVSVVGRACAGATAQPGGELDIVNVDILIEPAVACAAGVTALSLNRPTQLVTSRVRFRGASTDSVGVLPSETLRVLGGEIDVISDAASATGLRTFNAPVHIVRARVAAAGDDPGELVRALQGFPQSPLLRVLSSVIEAEGDTAYATFGTTFRFVAVHATFRALGTTSAIGAVADGEAFIASSLFESVGPNVIALSLDSSDTIIPGPSARAIVGNVFDADCVGAFEGGDGCLADPAAVEAWCAAAAPDGLDASGNVMANFQIAPGGALVGVHPAPGAAPNPFDLAAFADDDLTPIVVDADGTCRGASGLDAGANQL